MFHQFRSGITTLLVCCALLGPVVYPISYLALTDPVAWYPCCQTFSGTVHVSRSAHYRFGGAAATYCFRPIERLDRWYRPGYWDFADGAPSASTWQAALEYVDEVTPSFESEPVIGDSGPIAPAADPPAESSPEARTP